ncbi:MAG: Unannotated protein [Actinomycetota bacterium]|nr:Unannotated protein [Actinomycetota bacterium]
MSAQPPPVGDPHDIQFRVGPLVLDPHVLIYSTLMLLTAYALFDEGTELLVEGAWAGLIGITIAPLFALSMAHAFSDALDTQIRTGHRLTGAERRKIAADNLQYMYIGVPPIILLGILTPLEWDANDAVGLIVVLGLLSLAFWGAFAAYRAGLSWVRQLTFALGYGFMGLLVLLVELAITH